MKRFLSVFLILAMLCSFVISANAANPAVSVSSSKTAVDTGDTVTITVKLSSGSNLGAINFTVKYDTSEFQYVSNSVEASDLFLVEPNDRNAGRITYAGATMGVVTKGGVLMSFKLKVLKYGGVISVSVGEALDGDDKDVTSSVKASGITLKCAHGNAEWKVTKKATCTEKGVETGTCPCGNVSTRDISKTDHTVGKYTVTKEPTCTENGIKKAVCTTCNKEYTEEIKATGHTYGKWTVEKEATATAKGLKVAVCTVCGDKKEQTIAVISSTETTTKAETESSTKPSAEESTESTTFEEESTETLSNEEPSAEELSTEEPSTQASSGNVEEEKPSTAKTVVLTILATLGVEAVIAGLIILILKQRKKEKEQ